MNTTFSAKVFQNQFLPQGADEVHAIVNVANGESSEPAGGVPGQPASLVLGILIDCSGSMGEHGGERIHHAKSAVRHLIRLLREDCWFFVVAGSDEATLLSPLMSADAANKARADANVAQLQAGGGTKMSVWLEEARRQFPAGADSVRHALLLTDGKNDPSDARALDDSLAACEGRFQCDARGVGVDWQPDQLRRISGKLMGTVDIIPEPAGIAADFQAILEKAMGKAISEATLRLWTPQGAVVQYCKQVSPEIVDLTGRARLDPANPQLRDYPTGAWGKEARDYHLCIKVKPGAVGQKMLAGRVSLLVGAKGETKAAEGQVLAVWTDDEARSAVIDREVAHYTGQGELAQVIQEGLTARQAGDEDTATRKLGRAVQLAAESGNEATTKLLRNVVEVVDEKEGTVKLRRNINQADAMALDTRSTKTTRRSSPAV